MDKTLQELNDVSRLLIDTSSAVSKLSISGDDHSLSYEVRALAIAKENNMFILGNRTVKKAIKQIEAAKASEWISVEDRLPDKPEIVEVFWNDDGKCFDHDFYDEQWVNWFNCAEHFNIAGGNVSEVAPYTHWRRVEPPKEHKE